MNGFRGVRGGGATATFVPSQAGIIRSLVSQIAELVGGEPGPGEPGLAEPGLTDDAFTGRAPGAPRPVRPAPARAPRTPRPAA